MPNLIIPSNMIWVESTWGWVWPILTCLLYAALAMLLYRSALPRLRHSATALREPYADIVLNALGWPLLVLLSMAGCVLLFELWPIRDGLHNFVIALIKITFLLVAVSFSHQILNDFFRNSPPGSWMRITLLRKITLFALYTISSLMVFEILFPDLKTPLATLGIGSLAVALATQQILGNFFAGVQVSIDRTLEIGQSVTLENGMEGEVQSIGWLTTLLRAADGSRLLIPNNKLITFTIRNYTLGHRGPAVTIKIPVDRLADLPQAEEIAIAAAQKATAEISKGDRRMQPSVQFTEILAASAILTITLYAADYKTAAQTRSQFVKEVAAGLKDAGIKLAATV